jgi:ApaG protein
MAVLMTNQVQVKVETQFLPLQSVPHTSHYFFAYRITIQNLSDFTVQLLSRHWYIYDICMGWRQVKGQGVVGVQPVLEPGESYEYVSCCDLNNEAGKMFGYYTFIRYSDRKVIEVSIPEFSMFVPYRMN